MAWSNRMCHAGAQPWMREAASAQDKTPKTTLMELAAIPGPRLDGLRSRSHDRQRGWGGLPGPRLDQEKAVRRFRTRPGRGAALDRRRRWCWPAMTPSSRTAGHGGRWAVGLLDHVPPTAAGGARSGGEVRDRSAGIRRRSFSTGPRDEVAERGPPVSSTRLGRRRNSSPTVMPNHYSTRGLSSCWSRAHCSSPASVVRRSQHGIRRAAMPSRCPSPPTDRPVARE